MKVLTALLFVAFTALSQEPDYKALFEKANAAGAQWKALAEQRGAQIEQMKDLVALGEARAREVLDLRDKLKLAESRPADPQKVRQAANGLEKIVLENILRDKSEEYRQLLIGTRREPVTGRIISITKNGLILGRSGMDCFITTRTELHAYHDGQTVSFDGAPDGSYEYTTIHGARRNLPRYFDRQCMRTLDDFMGLVAAR